MNKILLLLCLTPFLMATQCNLEDEVPCDDESLRGIQYNLVTIENLKEVYEIGDVLWIDSELERDFVLESENITVDLFDFEGMSFHFNFDKTSIFDSSTYLCVNQDTFEIVNGTKSERCNGFEYEKLGSSFKSRFGIKLLEAGNFSLHVKEIQSFNEDCGPNSIIITTSFNDDVDTIFFEVQ